MNAAEAPARARTPSTSIATVAVLGAAFALGVLCLFAFFPPQSSVEEAKDFYDSFLAWYALRGQQSGFFFDFGYVVKEVFGGLPLNALGLSDFNPGVALFNVFDLPTAYALNRLLIHGIAFVGMYLLARDFVFRANAQGALLAPVAAYCFAVLPHQFWLMGTGAGLPLALWGYLGIWNGRRGAAVAVAVLIYPFYAYAVYGALQVYGVAIAATASAYRFNRGNFRALAAVTAIVLVLFVVVESRLFYHWFFADYEYISNRVIEPRGTSERTVIEDFFLHFVLGSETAFPTFHYPFVLLIVGACLLAAAVRRFVLQAAVDRRAMRLLLILLAAAVLTSVFIAFERRYYFAQLLLGIPLNLSRSDAWQPVLWWLLFALSVYLIGTFGRIGRAVAMPLVAAIALYATLQFPGVKYEIKEAVGIPQAQGLRAVAAAMIGLDGIDRSSRLATLLGIGTALAEGPPLGASGPLQVFRRHGEYRIADYFELEAMPGLKAALAGRLGDDPSRYKVLTIALSSSVAVYHGFSTLNAYLADYPAAAGQRFFAIFRREFAKDGMPVPLGSSNYVEAYLSRSSLRPGGDALDVDLDIDLFRELGGRAVFSFLRIENAGALGLASLGQFGRIYVYVLDS